MEVLHKKILIKKIGLAIGIAGTPNMIEFFLWFAPSGIAAFFLFPLFSNPLVGLFWPLLLFSGRGIQIEEDPYEKCRILCQVAEQVHNDKLKLEMSQLKPLVKEVVNTLNLSTDEVRLL